ncbi:30S ribosomal protein S4e [Halococcus sp. AFM35]|uniref:30S ribosomal protein S4e n=1 Tax=Halococcus sp. AFM35 TaxID=3421653 RepID=UPI003EBCF07A
MSKHQKRLSVPDSWPVERKTATFTVKADAGPHGEQGVPLLIVLRDVLGYVDSRKEARYALNQGTVLVNGESLDDEERPIGMFDIVEFEERDEHYRVFPDEGGRLALSPIDAGDADSKLGKIVGKGQVPGGNTQLALHDGHTLEVEDGEYAGGDSIVIDHDDEILAHFPYEEGALVTAVRGQHAGEIGDIEEIQVTPGSSPNNVRVSQDDGEGFETIAEYVVVIDENFVEGDEEETVTTAGEGAEVAEDTGGDGE